MRAPPSPAFRAARSLCGARSQRHVLLVMRVLQVLALVFSMQMSGVAHRMADLFFHDDCAAECGHDRRSGQDDDDTECPPGCPSCHVCGHMQVPFVPQAPSLGLAPLSTLIEYPHGERFTLPRGARAHVFRPPRSSRLSTV